MWHPLLFVPVVAEKYGKDAPSAVVVQAGSEPLRFTNLFPFWQTDTLAVSVLFYSLWIVSISSLTLFLGTLTCVCPLQGSLLLTELFGPSMLVWWLERHPACDKSRIQQLPKVRLLESFGHLAWPDLIYRNRQSLLGDKSCCALSEPFNISPPVFLVSVCIMLWRCWLGDRKGIRPVKHLAFVFFGDILTGALHILHLQLSPPLPASLTPIKLANPGLPGKWPRCKEQPWCNDKGNMLSPSKPGFNCCCNPYILFIFKILSPDLWTASFSYQQLSALHKPVTRSMYWMLRKPGLTTYPMLGEPTEGTSSHLQPNIVQSIILHVHLYILYSCLVCRLELLEFLYYYYSINRSHHFLYFVIFHVHF